MDTLPSMPESLRNPSSMLAEGFGQSRTSSQMPANASIVRRIHLADGPAGTFGQDLVFTVTPCFKLRQKSFIATVSHRDSYVTMQSFAARPFQRRTFEVSAKFRSVKRSEPAECRIDQLRPRPAVFFTTDRSTPVPGTDLLADVTTEDLPSYRLAKLFRNTAFLFDGEIGDTARSIHLTRSNESLRGTGVDTARAASATVCSQMRYSLCGNRNRSDNDSKQHPRPQLLMNQAGIFAYPSQTGLRGHTPLKDGAGVDVATCVCRSTFLEKCFKRTQL